ncbi:MAG: ABC transporter permease [Segetibacter sp.]
MLKNYFKIAIRNLSRHKLFSFINIFGLSLSMAICMLVLIHVNEQLSYDKFHSKADRIYRVITELTNKQGSAFRYASTALPLAPALNTDYNFIEQSLRLYNAAAGFASTDKKEIAIKTAFTDPGFFDVFEFSLSSGNPATALLQPNSIVLTSETATKLFGSDRNRNNPLGQTISFTQLGSFQVTGVMADTKGKSHIDFEAYLSMSSVAALEKTGKLPAMLSVWNSQARTYTYVLLKEGSSQKQLKNALNQVSASLLSTTKLQGKENFALDVQPFNKIILGEELQHSIGNVGSKGKLLAEVLIGFIILLSACFNYTNLSIARSLNRGKEVGIRKVAGAFRYQVFYQFILESVLISFLSLIAAFLILKAADRLYSSRW